MFVTVLTFCLLFGGGYFCLVLFVWFLFFVFGFIVCFCLLFFLFLFLFIWFQYVFVSMSRVVKVTGSSIQNTHDTIPIDTSSRRRLRIFRSVGFNTQQVTHASICLTYHPFRGDSLVQMVKKCSSALTLKKITIHCRCVTLFSSVAMSKFNFLIIKTVGLNVSSFATVYQGFEVNAPK